MVENGCSFGKVTRERLNNYEKTFDKFLRNDFRHLELDVKETKESVASIDKKQNKRPSWLTAAIIIGLTNLVVGLALAQIIGK